MFKDNINFKKLADEIYLYENFITSEEAKSIYKKAKSLKEEDWITDNKESYHEDKNSIPLDELEFVYKKLVDLFDPEYIVLPVKGLVRHRVGQDMYIHADSPGIDNADLVTSNDPYNTCHLIAYGIVIYINDDYFGGETYYPDLGIEYKGKPGDLIIHDSGPNYLHGVKTVEGTTRYAYINFVYPKM